jgi:CspA family cold shock protein
MEPRWPDQPRDDRGAGGFDRFAQRPASGPERDATVKWFNKEKGFGFVELGDGSGDAFLHIRAVEAAGYSDLLPGTRLTVRTAQGQKGPQVTDITTVDTSTATPDAGPRRDSRPPRSPGFGGGGGGGGRFAPSGPALEMSGTVKWYDPAKGFGFVSVGDGGKDVFVHRSALARAGIATLNEGQQVTMGVVEGQKGREAQTVSVAD